MAAHAAPATGNGRALVLLFGAWIASRLLVVTLARARGLYPYQDDPFDLAKFPSWGHAFATGHGLVPLRDGPWEYPAGAAAIVVLPTLLTGAPYAVGFAALMLAGDAALLCVLTLAGLRSGRLTGAWIWCAALPLLGPVALARYDVLPTLAAVGSMTLVSLGLPFGAGLLLGAGAASKAWPLLLLGPLVVLVPGRLRILAGVGAVLAGVGALTWLYGGGQQILSFLSYQRDRGLEVESLPALPLLLRHQLTGAPLRVVFGYGSYQVEAAGAAGLQRMASGALLALAVGVAALVWRASRADGGYEAALTISVFALSGLLCVDKVLSAQYPLWLAGVFALSLCSRASPLLPAVPLLLALMGTTQLLYPLAIQDLVALHPAGIWIAALRDLLLAGLAGQLAVLSWRATATKTATGQSENEVPVHEQQPENSEAAR